ncbi:MAG: hypothetical protein ACREWE_01680 [Gammaproteobacteria bacterium]
MISNIRRRLKGAAEEKSLPAPARAARRRDAQGWPGMDPGPERVIEAGILWLYRVQDCSASRDGGAARYYSLVSGWASSYPETTGYIVPTLIAYATLERNAEARRRARTMLDWLVSIQLPSGGYQGGCVDTDDRSPVTFNTGQILIGLAAGVEEFGDYREPMHRAADWLLETQNPDGCWRRHPTPFAKPGEKAYETHGRVPGRPSARRLVARGELGVPHRGRADRAVLAHALPLYRRHALPGGGTHGESVGSLHHRCRWSTGHARGGQRFLSDRWRLREVPVFELGREVLHGFELVGERASLRDPA